MTSEQRDKWIMALIARSDQQIDGFLHTSEGFCALGVYANDVLGVAWHKTEHPPEALSGVLYSYQCSQDCLNHHHKAVGVHVGTISKHVLDHKVAVHVSTMNDSGKSFDEIARWIKDNVEVEDE